MYRLFIGDTRKERSLSHIMLGVGVTLFHDLKCIGNGELGIRLALYFFHLNTRSKLRQCEFSGGPVHLEDTLYFCQFWLAINQGRRTYQVCNDGANNLGTSQRQSALLYNLRRSIFSDMARGNHDLGLVRVRDQIHCSSHTLEYLAGNHIVGQVAIGTHLQRTKNRHIYMASANHAEGLGAVECGGSRNQGNGLFSGIDNIAGLS